MKNAHRISLADLLESEGYDEADAFVLEHGNDDVVPALCDEYCEVEPDGWCEHGCPSFLLALGLI